MELADLVAHHHDALIEMFSDRAQRACAPGPLSRVELIDAVPFFLDAVVESLASRRERVDTEAAGAEHGDQRLKTGFRIDSVVREYFILAACILETAEAEGIVPTAPELRLLMRVVGNGAAAAASEYMDRRELDLMRREATHASFLAHDVRSSLAGARLGYDLLRGRELGADSELARVVDENLRRATQQIDQALLAQRLQAIGVSRSPLLLRPLLDEVVSELRAQIGENELVVTVAADGDLRFEADARLLRSAVTNLVGNAVKYTHRHGSVEVRGFIQDHSVAIEVEDGCGGLPAGSAERMFEAFTQAGADHDGFGLGLAIARAAVEAHGGTLRVRDLPGRGCIFTLELPRFPQPGSRVGQREPVARIQHAGSPTAVAPTSPPSVK